MEAWLSQEEGAAGLLCVGEATKLEGWRLQVLSHVHCAQVQHLAGYRHFQNKTAKQKGFALRDLWSELHGQWYFRQQTSRECLCNVQGILQTLGGREGQRRLQWALLVFLEEKEGDVSIIKGRMQSPPQGMLRALRRCRDHVRGGDWLKLLWHGRYALQTYEYIIYTAFPNTPCMLNPT